MTSLQHKTRGAALIIAILILAILLIIVLAFFQASRQEMHIATNYRNATQADLLAEGGTAIAIAFLNHDRLIHPTVTSIDHAWKTYFNGSWAAGKPYLWKYGTNAAQDNTIRTEGAGVPQFNLDLWLSMYTDPPGDALYIPRVDTSVSPIADPNAYSVTGNPFVVNYPGGVSGLAAAGLTADATLTGSNLGPLQVDRFADWDNDDDGLRDSAWIPMAMDKYPDTPAADGIDNDLDGVVDGTTTGAAERALFVYWGGNDGLDNDGDGNIDDGPEQRLYLTTSLGPIDIDGDGVLDNLPNIAINNFPNPNTSVGGTLSQSLNPNYGSSDIDLIDNDYNLVLNDRGSYAYDLPSLADPSTWTTDELAVYRQRQANGYNLVDSNYLGVDPTTTLRRLTFVGEPVSELVGRAAVLVKDENSKVNINAAGGRNFRDDDSPYVQPQGGLSGGELRRALWGGASTAEYETRVLPQLGTPLTDRLWDLRMGSVTGVGYPSLYTPGPVTGFVNPNLAAVSDGGYGISALRMCFPFDVSLPGFGRVDDNGNAMWMAMDGVDNDGDGLVDEGLADLPHVDAITGNLVYDNAMTTDEAWTFEGIDEPQEYQSYRPLRNHDIFGGNNPSFAENDGNDNYPKDEIGSDNADGSVDEIGELGDRYLRSNEQAKLARGIGPETYGALHNFITVNGTDLNSRFQRFNADGDPLPIPVLSGPKLDYNYATVEQIVNAIQRDWGYVATAPTGAGGDVLAYARGLRREDAAIFSPSLFAGGAANLTLPSGLVQPAFPPDAALRAAQLAANIRDNRDPDLGRTEVTTAIDDTWADGRIFNGARSITYTQSGAEAIRINEIMARPVRRVEAEMSMSVVGVEANFNPNYFSAIPVQPDFNMVASEPNPATPLWVRNGGVLGSRSYLSTVDTALADPANVPHVIQFRFAPSPGLPPTQFDPASLGNPRRVGGRYYLMMNSQRYNAVTGRMEATVVGSLLDPILSQNIEYTFKYGTAAQDILTDVANSPATVPWKSSSAMVGYRNMQFPVVGTETGMVFLPSDPNFDDAAPAGYGDNEAYTVHIPPYDTANPANQLYLYVAIRFVESGNAESELAVNYFDFSQEPDHEWIEVVNTAETGGPALNIGGWELQVGADSMTREDGSLLGPTVMSIPLGTSIAPGGSLLLGFNKYDGGGHEAAGTGYVVGNPPLLDNGIGLARIIDAAYNVYMTEPPIPGVIPGFAQEPSVFARNLADPDLNDWTGDGVPDADDVDGDGQFLYDSNGDGTLDTDIADKVFASTADVIVPAGANKAFDRIVQLNGALDAVTDLPTLGAMLLNGGILPNYPEHDGIDNDGDNFALLTDGIDNDGDGMIDEGVDVVDGIDNNGNGTIDEAGERIDTIDARPEGVDEGRWEYIVNTALTPPAPYGLRGDDSPASYTSTTIPYIYAAANGAATLASFPYAGAGTDVTLPATADPPEWKAFSERRWYTPDNVIVTLYAGTKADGHVADRVTYTEQDVINRAPDDILTCPYPHWVDDNGDGIEQRSERYTPNAGLTSFWPDNTMGVDFYRSIERKHPFYNGDLHGLSNRWQATDGNYDDWSPSTSMFERDLTTSASSNTNTVLPRLYDLVAGTVLGTEPLYHHAFSGSPLRMNMSQRYMENPDNQFTANDAWLRRWAFQKARQSIRNRTYVSPGDLATLASFMDRREYGTPTIEYDDTAINYTHHDPLNAAVLIHQDVSVQGVMLAQHPYDDMFGRDDMAAVVGSAAMDPLVLAAGTANFYTILPQPADWNNLNSAVAWDGTTTANDSPQPWTPVFLFPFPNADANGFPLDVNRLWPSYTMNTLSNYLFTGPYGGAITNLAAYDPGVLAEADLAVRWPLKLRTVMYGSQNLDTFDPTVINHEATPAATALFEWNGSDGLENGDYDVYLMTAEDLTMLSAADSRAGNDYLTPFGRNLVNESLNPATQLKPQDMLFDVEMFTDRSYTGNTPNVEPLGPNGRCWIDGSNGNPADNYPQPGEFERAFPVNPLNPQGDSFGLLVSRHPDDGGVLYYGTVRVENNYLALLLRNWTPHGKLARFSRVILTPHQRTGGRLNINTVESAGADFGNANPDEFNPLVGTPGLLADYDSTSPLRFSYFPEGDIGPATPAYVQGILLSDNIVTNRQRLELEPVSGTLLPIRYHPDGRYYDSTSELVAPHPNEFPNGDPMNTYPDFISAAPTAPPANVFEEMMGRYSRLANLVTTRSDVFEITVTAQTGYLSNEDLNGDGRIDYRNDFIVTGEKKIRTVYER